MPCAGKASESCEGAFKINIHERSERAAAATESPKTPMPPQIYIWKAEGCYNNSQEKQIFPNPAILSFENPESPTAGLTIEKCLTGCETMDHQFAAVKNGNKCYCDNASMPYTEQKPETSGCDVECQGDFTQKCGGKQAINLFSRVMASSLSTG